MKWNIMITHQTPELARAGKVGVVAKYEFEGTKAIKAERVKQLNN